MNLFQALIFGIVEGITEFLPISSTGHLMLTARVLGIEQTEFIKSFEIAIQLGAILAVVFIYRKILIKGLDIWKRILIAFIPTACLGAVFYKIIKKFLLVDNSIVLWSLFLGGIFLIVFELAYRQKEGAADDLATISYKQAFFVGIFQSIAMIPGVSRAAATIIGGLSLGIKRKAIVEFSFLLAIPTMLAATGLDLAKNASSFDLSQIYVLSVGFAASFVVAMLTIRFLLFFIKSHNFVIFGVYRIIVALLFWWIK